MFGELITLRQLNLPVKVVVFNNGSLAFVELEMKAEGIVNYATDLDNPNFAEVARAIGLYGRGWSTPANSTGRCGCLRPRWSGCHRGHDRPPRDVDPAKDHRGPDQGIHSLGHPHDPLRPGR